MCEFKPGDEVVCVTMVPSKVNMIGKTFTVEAVYIHPAFGMWVVHLMGVDSELCPILGRAGYRAERFRKVQRRDLSAWLKTATKFEEPKRKKANA